MATPTEVDRCGRLEDQDATLTSLKLGISNYSDAQPTLVSLRKSSHLKDLFITSSIGDHDVGRLCREVLLQNTSLEHLTLDLRECSDRGAQYLAELIQYNRNLQWLSLMLNNVTEKGALRLAEALGKSSLLGFSIYATQLDLHDCCIGDSGAAHFASALESCGTLTSVCIAQNAVTNSGLENILRGLSANPAISLLDLHSNLIDKMGAAKVAAFLISNSSLKQLILDENHDIGSEGGREIAIALCQNSTLETISLKSCSIGGKGAQWFATTLFHNKNLRELILCGNVDIGDDAVELICRGLKQNMSLQKLDLSSCGVGDEGCAHIAEAVVGNMTLLHLALHKNEIGDGGALALSGTLALDNCALTSLILTENRFGEKGASALMSSLQHNSSVTTLSLEGTSSGNPESAMKILLAKNRELMKYKKLVQELQQRNKSLTQEIEACRAEFKCKTLSTKAS